jgi:hypothetical protein
MNHGDTQHDPTVCFCGDAIGCSCPCRDCQVSRNRLASLDRQEALRKRLEKAGINIEDFAGLIFLCFESYFEQRIETLTKATLQEKLRNLTMVSQVQSSSVK